MLPTHHKFNAFLRLIIPTSPDDAPGQIASLWTVLLDTDEGRLQQCILPRRVLMNCLQILHVDTSNGIPLETIRSFLLNNSFIFVSKPNAHKQPLITEMLPSFGSMPSHRDCPRLSPEYHESLSETSASVISCVSELYQDSLLSSPSIHQCQTLRSVRHQSTPISHRLTLKRCASQSFNRSADLFD
ncbi:unnamed protein product [Dicrocoelium dendriticum]|nr:unnamed protein product [Dicrocoelium dendriticum]